MPFQTYSQLQHISPHHPDKSRVWRYPKDHVFFRSRMSIKLHRPPRSQFHDSEPVDGEADNVPYVEKEYSGNGVAGQDGSLEMLTTMPVDILYEIFSHLHPMDVLNLSRTTKPLRAILLGHHARSVWRLALGGVRALPPCPPDLTEIEYASLAFDNWCQSCLAPNIEKILWECRVRYCKKCIKKHFIQEDELDLWIPEDVLIEKPDTIFPLAYIVQPRNRNNGNGRTKPVYLLSTAQEYLKELDEVVRTQDEKALTKWSQQKKELQDMKITHAALCVYWDTHWAYRRSPRVSPSRLLEAIIIIILVQVLTFLWREKLLNVGV